MLKALGSRLTYVTVMATVAVFLACGLACASLAATADAARLRLSLRGDDHLLWTATAGGTCYRTGGGSQDVSFRSTRTVTVQIRQVRLGRGKALVFGRRFYNFTVAARGTVVRFDETTDPTQEGCPISGPRDCGTKSLVGFAPTIASNRRAGFTLWAADHFYWDTAESPFQNCVALQTPVENPEATTAPYTGWQFGNEPLYRADESTMATRPVSPDALRVGRIYHFKATKFIRLSDHGMGYRYIIGTNGESGPPLGGDRSISDRTNWEITLKRVS